MRRCLQHVKAWVLIGLSAFDLLIGVLVQVTLVLCGKKQRGLVSNCLRRDLLQALGGGMGDLEVENSDLANGAHASAFRVCVKPTGESYPRIAAVLKLWEPSTLSETLAWAGAAMELRTAIAYAKAGFNSGVDFKATLSRRGQYLASFEVEASLYKACDGHAIRVAANAPSAHLVASGLSEGAAAGFRTIMLLEDICAYNNGAPVDGVVHHKTKCGSWCAKDGFGAVDAGTCLRQLAQLHARFWWPGEAVGKTNARSGAQLTEFEDRVAAIAKVRRTFSETRKPARDCRKDTNCIDIWAEGGYWLGAKRPLQPLSAGKCSGKRGGRYYDCGSVEPYGAEKVDEVQTAIVRAWDEVQELL